MGLINLWHFELATLNEWGPSRSRSV